ncbi:S26 family signal peptidase [Acidovorax sp. LjRoot129]|uniref:S26 family signal peptidase n=1 Tax=Acidovorax sp. LjRoot129 TaxID=3342260 RepID=UPI003ECF6817
MNRRLVLACMGIGVATLYMPTIVQSPTRLVYNPSDSVSRGWYLISSPGALHVGSIVLVRLPVRVAGLAAQRGYLPAGIPLLKRIGAMAPQLVCVGEGAVRVDGTVVAAVLEKDEASRELQSWPHCRALVDGEVFLLSSAHPGSYDSRYFGPVDASAVIGKARPMWVWSMR